MKPLYDTAPAPGAEEAREIIERDRRSGNYGRCDECGEVMRGSDPGLTPMSDGRKVCCFCGYWSVPPGTAREAIRAERDEKLLLSRLRVTMSRGGR